jgi:putative membrane protein
MTILIAALAIIAALIHVLFFCMESLWWNQARVMKRFRMTEEVMRNTQPLAFNQGFYNLFLAIGAVLGVILLLGGREDAGMLLIAWNCASMLGAAVVLRISSAAMLRGALTQGIVPALTLALLAARL